MASNYLGQFSCPSSGKENEECMCLGTPRSHIPSTSTTKAWVELTRWTVSSHVSPVQLAVLGKNWYWPLFVQASVQHNHSHFLVHCEIEENPLSYLIFRREVIMLFSRWIDHNQLQGRRLVEENLSVCQMELRETEAATNSKQGLKGDAQCAKRMHNTDSESVV